MDFSRFAVKAVGRESLVLLGVMIHQVVNRSCGELGFAGITKVLHGLTVKIGSKPRWNRVRLCDVVWNVVLRSGSIWIIPILMIVMVHVFLRDSLKKKNLQLRKYKNYFFCLNFKGFRIHRLVMEWNCANDDSTKKFVHFSVVLKAIKIKTKTNLIWRNVQYIFDELFLTKSFAAVDDVLSLFEGKIGIYEWKEYWNYIWYARFWGVNKVGLKNLRIFTK